jgi:hypothetical protein
MIEEGYDNRKGIYYNSINGNQREAPAPFIHYAQDGMNYEGMWTVDASGNLDYQAVDTTRKLYFVASSTSTGWFTNPQGVYRTSTKGGRILGANPQTKITGGGNPEGYVTDNGTTASNTNNNTRPGWVRINGHESGSTNGGNGSFLFGTADDGSDQRRGYDGQTTYVQQLRYPKFKWGIIGFRDFGYAEPDFEDYASPGDDPFDLATKKKYYAYLNTLYRATGFRKPIYGQTEIPEPLAGKLVWGKYIHMQDSWDSAKNYDARYIWVPMRVTDTTGIGTTPIDGANNYGPYATRGRWMKEWRWEDFVYNLGPFARSHLDNPTSGTNGGNIVDSTRSSASMWTTAGNPQNLLDYYEMLNECFGSSNDWYLNPGKQNFGQNWLEIQFPDIFGGL